MLLKEEEASGRQNLGDTSEYSTKLAAACIRLFVIDHGGNRCREPSKKGAWLKIHSRWPKGEEGFHAGRFDDLGCIKQASRQLQTWQHKGSMLLQFAPVRHSRGG